MPRTMQVWIHFSESVGGRSREDRVRGDASENAWVVGGGPSPTLATHVARLLASLETMRPEGDAPVGEVDEASATDSGVPADGAAVPGRPR
jgi:hypothetical protein